MSQHTTAEQSDPPPEHISMGIEELCDACEDGDDDEVEAIIGSGEVDVNEMFDDSTPLISAIVWNRPSIVRILLSHPDTGLDMTDSKGFTCLHWACYHNNVEIIKIIWTDTRCTPELINKKSSGGDSALMVCVWRVHVEALKEMGTLDECDFGTKDAKGLTLMDVARDKSDTEEIIEFLEEMK